MSEGRVREKISVVVLKSHLLQYVFSGGTLWSLSWYIKHNPTSRRAGFDHPFRG